MSQHLNRKQDEQAAVPQVSNDFEVVAQPTSEDASGRSAPAAMPTLRRMTHKEVDAFMEGEAILIPVKILKEWRRGMMCCLDHKGQGSIHAGEIIEEIEGYLQ